MSVEREMWLGQVKAALRPRGIDPVEVREVLMAALAEGFNPVELYLDATLRRAQGLERPPSLTQVLPPKVLQEQAEMAEAEGVTSE